MTINLRDQISPDDIMSVLKLSYHDLESLLQSCFSYCATGEEMLISLWMAQGYIVSLDEGQSIEDADEKQSWSTTKMFLSRH